jgi:3-methyladenine DNA glycosylase/8-oxoguanine DNA glycosylase
MRQRTRSSVARGNQLGIVRTSTLTIRTPAAFGFWPTVYSHGWCALPPFRVDKEAKALERVLTVRDGTLVDCRLRQGRNGNIAVELRSAEELSPSQKQEVKAQLGACLRLEQDLSEFYALARREVEFRWVPRAKAGRLLRAPTVFEDVVKMICTTNCSWSLTEIMVGNLVSKLGRESVTGNSGFPTPEALADVNESFLRKEIRSGYRSPYLMEFALSVAEGKLDPESWRSSSLPTQELFKTVRSVKGMGDYAAGNIMKLLGHYDYLGLDSWVRGKFSEIHKNGRKVSDRTIERTYRRFGVWRGLFFWLEMTRDWYNRTFPF